MTMRQPPTMASTDALFGNASAVCCAFNFESRQMYGRSGGKLVR